MPETHAVVETEKKFRCDTMDELIDHAICLGFMKVQENTKEHDMYFTDKEYTFIEQKICLRIRQTDTHCEITHKWQSYGTGAFYSKVENNIQIAQDGQKNAIALIESLWFIRYIDVKKTRDLYRKDIDGLAYHIAIDYIEGAWYFVEFEILSQRTMEEDQIKIFFESFVDLFTDFDLQEEVLPYRDIVKKMSI